jgi:methyl-accepting chemotaxis protein
LSKVKAGAAGLRTMVDGEPTRRTHPAAKTMDLNQAIEKHSEWKVKFRAAIAKREQMDAGTIAKDNCCELGKWLHGDAKSRWSALPAYRSCLSRHADFHNAAGQVARAINAQRYTEAEAMLAADTSYGTASRDVVTAIMRLKKEAAL